MGQIKNIKLHIVTDIKVSLINIVTIHWLRTTQHQHGYRYRTQQRQEEAQRCSRLPGSLPSHPCEIVPFPCSTNGCEVQQSHLETIVYEQDQQTSNLLGSNRSSNDKICVVVGTVTDDIRLLDVPKLTICALRFTESA